MTCFYQKENIINYLLDKVNIDECDYNNTTPLQMLCQSGNIKLVIRFF